MQSKLSVPSPSAPTANRLAISGNDVYARTPENMTTSVHRRTSVESAHEVLVPELQVITLEEFGITITEAEAYQLAQCLVNVFAVLTSSPKPCLSHD